jgi:hypothetical protein
MLCFLTHTYGGLLGIVYLIFSLFDLMHSAASNPLILSALRAFPSSLSLFPHPPYTYSVETLMACGACALPDG